MALSEFILSGVIITLMIGWVTALEVLAPKGRYSLWSRLPGLGFNLVNALCGGLLVALLISLWAKIGVQPLAFVPVRGVVGDLLSVVASVLLLDLIAYWNHRFQHRFLWRIHALHHCQTDLHAANDYAHFTERGLSWLLFAVPLSLVHFDFAPTATFLVMGRLTLEFYIHSPTRVHLGSAVLVDNRFHRIHHSLEERHFDKNFGILFSFWDRIFGTAYEPAGEWPATGVAGLRPPASVKEYLLFPLTVRPTYMDGPREGSLAAPTSTPDSLPSAAAPSS